MSVTINHQTNDISTTGSPLTIGGAPVGGAAIGGGAAQSVNFDTEQVFISTCTTDVLTYTFSATGLRKATILLENTRVILWGVAGSEYIGNEFYVSDQVFSTDGFYMSNDGTKLYTCGGNNVYQYILSTAWDLSTASYDTNFTASQDPTGGIFFKPDGTKFYFTNFSSDRVYQYSLGTPWDITTASYDSVEFLTNPPENTPRGIFFSPDGLNMFVNGASVLYRYTLSTAWLMSSATQVSSLTIPIGDQRNAFTVFFSPDGTNLYIPGSTGVSLYRWTLPSAWDITTATYTGEFFDLSHNISGLNSVYITPDGDGFYVLATASIGSGVSVYQYNMSGTISVVFPAECEIPSTLEPPLIGEKAAYTFVTTDSGVSYQLTASEVNLT